MIPCSAITAQIPGQEEPGQSQKDPFLLPGLIHYVPFMKGGTGGRGFPVLPVSY